MSDDNAPSPEPSSNPPAEGAPRVRRISNPRPKKAAKAGRTPQTSSEAPVPEPQEKQEKSPKFPDFSDAPQTSEPEDGPSLRTDWPEPEAPSSGTQAFPENPKRKRRRKKGKGNNPQNQSPASETETISLSSGEPAEPQSQSQPQRQQHQAPRPKLDSELLAKFAWKIYLSEVSEEGVALVGDNDAKELSRRCFRLAEIFMEEQARRR